MAGATVGGAITEEDPSAVPVGLADQEDFQVDPEGLVDPEARVDRAVGRRIFCPAWTPTATA